MSELIYKETKDEQNNYHSYNDEPALIYRSGTMHWYCHGKVHRDNGPAYINIYGHKFWYHHGKLHRENGPAVEYSDGDKEWWYEGKECTFHEWIKLVTLPDEQKVQIILSYE